MAKEKSVLVRMSEDLHESLEEHSEAKGISMAHVARQGIKAEIGYEDHDGSSGAAVDAEELRSVVADAVTDAVEDAVAPNAKRTDERLRRIENALTTIQEEVGEETPSVDNDLLIDYIPSVDLVEAVGRDENGQPQGEYRPTEEIVAEAKSANEIANEIGVPLESVENGIEQLMIETPLIQAIEHNGTTYYHVKQ
jgi:hypothetical protein